MSEEATLDHFENVGDSEKASGEHPRYGSVPEGWEIMEISEVADVVGGSTPSTSDDDYWGGDIRWATPTDLTDLSGNTISETEDRVTQEGLESASTHLLPPYSVLMTSRATIGKCAVNTVEMATNQGFQNLVPGDKVETWYLHYRMLETAAFLDSLGSGSTFDEVSKTEVQSVDIPVPPLEEQRKIATVLHNVDRALSKSKEILQQRKRLKTGVRQDIFRYGINEQGELRTSDEGDELYRQTKYGDIPTEWDIAPLDELVPDDSPVVYGILKPGQHQEENGIPVVKVKDIHDGEIKQSDLLHTTQEIHEDFKRAELKEGDLLFTIRGTVGRMAFVPENLEGGNITQDTARIRITGANPQYVRYFFETATPNNYFERNTVGQAVQGINLGELRDVPVHLPPEDEQERIVKILDQHSEALRNERENIDRLKRLKKGLMQDLLSGKVRTTDTNIEVPEEVKQHG